MDELEDVEELPICIHCGCSIRDGVHRVWEEVSRGNRIVAHMYLSACVSELRHRVEVLEGK